MTNEEAELLVSIAKRLQNYMLAFPEPGTKEYYKANDLAKIRKFTVQAYRGKRSPSNCSFVLLYRKRTMLLRVDTDGAGMHYNTDGTIIPPHTPHMHIFDEAANCHNAVALPDSFRNPEDGARTLLDFLRHISIVDMERVQIVQQEGFQL